MLTGKLAIVTGGGRGIGAGITRALAGQPEDIGQLAAFLASDAARNITGQWIAVDGGITLRQAT